MDSLSAEKGQKRYISNTVEHKSQISTGSTRVMKTKQRSKQILWQWMCYRALRLTRSYFPHTWILWSLNWRKNQSITGKIISVWNQNRVEVEIIPHSALNRPFITHTHWSDFERSVEKKWQRHVPSSYGDLMHSNSATLWVEIRTTTRVYLSI